MQNSHLNVFPVNIHCYQSPITELLLNMLFVAFVFIFVLLSTRGRKLSRIKMLKINQTRLSRQFLQLQCKNIKGESIYKIYLVFICIYYSWSCALCKQSPGALYSQSSEAILGNKSCLQHILDIITVLISHFT